MRARRPGCKTSAGQEQLQLGFVETELFDALKQLTAECAAADAVPVAASPHCSRSQGGRHQTVEATGRRPASETAT
jgi:hypothetical protein